MRSRECVVPPLGAYNLTISAARRGGSGHARLLRVFRSHLAKAEFVRLLTSAPVFQKAGCDLSSKLS